MYQCPAYDIVRGCHTFPEHHTEGILGGMEYLRMNPMSGSYHIIIFHRPLSAYLGDEVLYNGLERI